MSEEKPYALALTGASGMPYALRLLEVMLKGGHRVDLMLSAPGQIVIGMETALKLPGRCAGIRRYLAEHYAVDEALLRVFGREEWTAPLASGSSAPKAMVVCPCTTGTLASIAAGTSGNLIERAADVAIKEGRKLVLVPREMPFSAIHLENMLKLARLGVVIMPPSPGFYQGVTCIDDLVNFVVSRVLDQIGIDNDLSPRWGEESPGDAG
ncbi:4-hydroxy-3-polyprenylbenzoate decarboxylase [Thiogranum longum]|uniref:Flavin prenyltransferase UbiX n=1 Tax=Thiogranum longum TaxID=1537524 RepID=A0A4R1HG83_9GAMM|nr:flavin prenyltransferase UbiX [Thiogranum longum]TCK19415.1 4-hydroxy-3-polyprenylbenzoate decarboxylase [Thiogranum longum]